MTPSTIANMFLLPSSTKNLLKNLPSNPQSLIFTASRICAAPWTRSLTDLQKVWRMPHIPQLSEMKRCTNGRRHPSGRMILIYTSSFGSALTSAVLATVTLPFYFIAPHWHESKTPVSPSLIVKFYQCGVTILGECDFVLPVHPVYPILSIIWCKRLMNCYSCY